MIKTGSDTTEASEDSPDPVNNIRPEALMISNETEGGHDERSPPELTPRRADDITLTSPCDIDLKEIKDYFVRHADLRSAPAVLFGSVQEDDTEWVSLDVGLESGVLFAGPMSRLQVMME